MEPLEEQIVNEGLSANQHTLLEYRKAVMGAFFIGERLKKEFDMIPPKFLWKGVVPGTDSEFHGRIGLEIAGDWIKSWPAKK